MANVDMIVGQPLFMENEIMITPISRVKLTFATGGMETKEMQSNNTPYGGLTGSTISIEPVCFIVCNGLEVNLLHVNSETHLYEKVIDSIPDLASKIKKLFTKE